MTELYQATKEFLYAVQHGDSEVAQSALQRLGEEAALHQNPMQEWKQQLSAAQDLATKESEISDMPRVGIWKQQDPSDPSILDVDAHYEPHPGLLMQPVLQEAIKPTTDPLQYKQTFPNQDQKFHT